MLQSGTVLFPPKRACRKHSTGALAGFSKTSVRSV
jgi:hypothetical protein